MITFTAHRRDVSTIHGSLGRVASRKIAQNNKFCRKQGTGHSSRRVYHGGRTSPRSSGRGEGGGGGVADLEEEGIRNEEENQEQGRSVIKGM